MIESIDEVLSAADGADLGSMEMTELRVMRSQAAALEADVSLVRRVAQGRLDILGHERQRRVGETPNSAPDLSGVLFDLPDILTDRRTSGNVSGLPDRVVRVGEPGAAAAEMFEKLDGLASSSELAAVESASDADIAAMAGRLRNFEDELSESRRSLHGVIDAAQAEIARRYRDGEASVDALLS